MSRSTKKGYYVADHLMKKILAMYEKNEKGHKDLVEIFHNIP
jgi:ribosomal protein S19